MCEYAPARVPGRVFGWYGFGLDGACEAVQWQSARVIGLAVGGQRCALRRRYALRVLGSVVYIAHD